MGGNDDKKGVFQVLSQPHVVLDKDRHVVTGNAANQGLGGTNAVMDTANTVMDAATNHSATTDSPCIPDATAKAWLDNQIRQRTGVSTLHATGHPCTRQVEISGQYENLNHIRPCCKWQAEGAGGLVSGDASTPTDAACKSTSTGFSEFNVADTTSGVEFGWQISQMKAKQIGSKWTCCLATGALMAGGEHLKFFCCSAKVKKVDINQNHDKTICA